MLVRIGSFEFAVIGSESHLFTEVVASSKE